MERLRIAAVVERGPAGWVVLGLLGTALVAAAAPPLSGDGIHWFLGSILLGHPGTERALGDLGVVALVLAWLGLGASLRGSRRPHVRTVCLVALAWSVPLVVVPPLFSQDVFSYLAQGAILHGGLDPYRVAPTALAHLGQGRLEAAVSPFWRSSTAPYGPSFIGAMSLLADLARSDLALAVVAARLVEVAGLGAIAAAVTVIARRLGTDPARAVWLAVASPLSLFELVAAGHNDALMAGLMALGVAAALGNRPFLGLGLCSAAATVKAPAALAVVVIAWCWLGELPEGRSRLGFLAKGLLAIAPVPVVVSLATGVGTAWLSPSVLSSTGRLHLAITPVSEVDWVVRALVDLGGGSTTLHAVNGPVSSVALVLAGVFILSQLARLSRPTLVRTTGRCLIIVALAGPAAWPWYFLWGLSCLSCTPGVQRSKAVAGLVALSVVLVNFDGILVLPFDTAPVVLGVVAVAVGAYFVRSRRAPVAGARVEGPVGVPS